MEKHLFKMIVAFLIGVLSLVSFYMLWVHVPYYNYHHNLDEIRNEICETYNYEYMDYFTEYRGKQKYYIIKVKINGVLSYVAYDKDKKLVDTYQGNIVDEISVKEDILKKYKDEVNDDDLKVLDVGYENKKFVYYVKVQREHGLLYLYYDLSDGAFMKAYRIESDK